MERIPEEITITPLGIALGIAVEMGIVSKEDPDVLEKFRNYWEKVEKYVLPYAFERMKVGETTHNEYLPEVEVMNNILGDVQVRILPDLEQTKEVYETKDNIEAAKMIGTGKWTIINGCIQGNEVLWVLARFR